MAARLCGKNVIFAWFLRWFYDLDKNAACVPVKLSGKNVIVVLFLRGFYALD